MKIPSPVCILNATRRSVSGTATPSQSKKGNGKVSEEIPSCIGHSFFARSHKRAFSRCLKLCKRRSSLNSAKGLFHLLRGQAAGGEDPGNDKGLRLPEGRQAYFINLDFMLSVGHVALHLPQRMHSAELGSLSTSTSIGHTFSQRLQPMQLS